MKRDVKLFILDIIESIHTIETYLGNRTDNSFLEDQEKQDAVVRRLEIIGEAAKNAAPRMKKKFPEVEWSEIAKFRDKIAHGYFGIDPVVILDVVKNDLPVLKTKIEKILSEMEKEG